MLEHTGLTDSQVQESRQKFGSNALTELPREPLLAKFLASLKDPMIIILLCALAIQLVLFFLGRAEWFEPVGILIAVLIASGVSSITSSAGIRRNHQSHPKLQHPRDSCE